MKYKIKSFRLISTCAACNPGVSILDKCPELRLLDRILRLFGRRIQISHGICAGHKQSALLQLELMKKKTGAPMKTRQRQAANLLSATASGGD